MWIAHGLGDALPEPAHLREVAPTLLAALGVDWSSDPGGTAGPLPYSPEEQAQVAERLRALGYLE